MSSALEGLRVLELAGERTAFAGKLLADMGADVIVVEPPAGDATRSFAPLATMLTTRAVADGSSLRFT